jgi:hypothetical protein
MNSCSQTEEEPYLRVGPGSPGYTRGGGPRSPGDPYARTGGPRSPGGGSGSPDVGGPRSGIKRRSREEEEEEQQRKKTGAAKASIAAKVGKICTRTCLSSWRQRKTSIAEVKENTYIYCNLGGHRYCRPRQQKVGEKID